jgi:DNA-3-methyladenine glycosylase II
VKTAAARTGSLAGIQAAERHLARVCVVMARLIAAHGPCALADGDEQPFQTLAGSIMGQQLSAKAAGTIRARVHSLVPDFDPEIFLVTAPEALRQAGLSAAKIRSVRDLAQRSTDGSLDLAALADLTNEEVIVELTTVRGIGRWTAEMFLIFGLKRLNVLALSDAGLRRAVRLLYGDATTLEYIGARWHPYCSVASWYLWRHLDTPTQAV